MIFFLTACGQKKILYSQISMSNEIIWKDYSSTDSMTSQFLGNDKHVNSESQTIYKNEKINIATKNNFTKSLSKISKFKNDDLRINSLFKMKNTPQDIENNLNLKKVQDAFPLPYVLAVLLGVFLIGWLVVALIKAISSGMSSGASASASGGINPFVIIGIIIIGLLISWIKNVIDGRPDVKKCLKY